MTLRYITFLLAVVVLAAGTASAGSPAVQIGDLPSTVTQDGVKRDLYYDMQLPGIAGGFARAGIGQIDRPFLINLGSKAITLGPLYPKVSSTMVLTASSDGTKLTALVNSYDPEPTYHLLSTSDLQNWQEIQLPVQSSNIAFAGPDQSGNFYMTLRADATSPARHFSVTPEGTLSELFSIPDDYRVYEVSPGGLLATALIFGDSVNAPWPVLVTNGHTDTAVVSGTIPHGTRPATVLDNGQIAMASLESIRLVDLQSNQSGVEIPGHAGWITPLSTNAVAVQAGNDFAVFDMTRKMYPDCVLPRKQHKRTLESPKGRTAGESVVVDGTRNGSGADFLVTPNLNGRLNNYCTEVRVTPVGLCANYFTGGGTAIVAHKTGSGITPSSCVFNIKYVMKSNSKQLPGKLTIELQASGWKSKSKYKLTGKPLRLRLPTNRANYIIFTGDPGDSSLFINGKGEVDGIQLQN